MTGDMKLSQAEIDALLNPNQGSGSPGNSEQLSLSDFEKDALGEIGNISFGSAATALSTLLQQRVDITTPKVTLLQRDMVQNEFPRPYVMVSVEFTQGLSGSNALAIELPDAKTIADLMLGGDGTHAAGELNELHLSAVGEAMNQMMGSAATAMSTIFGRPINISPPSVQVVDLSSPGEFQMTDADWLVDVAFNLKVGTLIDSKIMQLIPVNFARELVNALQSVSGTAPTPAQSEPNPSLGNRSQAPMAAESATTQSRNSGNSDKPNASSDLQGAAMGRAVLTSRQEMAPALESVQAMEPTLVRRPEFSDFSQATSTTVKEPRNLALLFDVPLTVTVELGRTKKSIKEILDMSSGAILELDKLAGEPVDILVNNKRIAIGEVVVIDENFGVRVTDILSPVERVKNLH